MERKRVSEQVNEYIEKNYHGGERGGQSLAYTIYFHESEHNRVESEQLIEMLNLFHDSVEEALPENPDIVDEIYDSASSMCAIYEEEAFYSGLRAGILLMRELLEH